MIKVRLAVCALIAVAGICVLPLTAASADTANYNVTPPATTPINNGFSGGAFAPAVEGNTGVRVAPVSLSTAPSTAPTSGSTLPFTGGDVAGLAVIGALLVLVGLVLVRRNRVQVA